MQVRTWRLGVGKEARGKPIYHRARRSRDLALVQRGYKGGVFRASLALFTGLPGQEVHWERWGRGWGILCKIESCKNARFRGARLCHRCCKEKKEAAPYVVALFSRSVTRPWRAFPTLDLKRKPGSCRPRLVHQNILYTIFHTIQCPPNERPVCRLQRNEYEFRTRISSIRPRQMAKTR